MSTPASQAVPDDAGVPQGRRGLTFGSLSLDVPFFQAAISGYTDYAMRRLGKDFGAPLTLTGVMLSKSVADPRVLKSLSFHPHDDEHPVGAQILGEDVRLMVKAAKDLVGLGYDLVDLNFACPAPKVLRRKRGGAMLQKPSQIAEIHRAVRDAVTCPLLMKLRIGLDSSELSEDCFWEIVERVIGQGIDGLVIHGRTVVQKYGGKADWQVLAEVKRRFAQTPILGSGDLFDVATCLERLRTTGLDGVVLARGAVGNPWLIRDLRAAFEGRPTPPPPSIEEQRQIIERHFAEVLKLRRGERRAVGYFRKFLVNYAKRHPQRKKVLATLLAAKTTEQLLAGIERWYTGAGIADCGLRIADS
jgi:nifR3 family TIM-barrel protein